VRAVPRAICRNARARVFGTGEGGGGGGRGGSAARLSNKEPCTKRATSRLIWIGTRAREIPELAKRRPAKCARRRKKKEEEFNRATLTAMCSNAKRANRGIRVQGDPGIRGRAGLLLIKDLSLIKRRSRAFREAPLAHVASIKWIYGDPGLKMRRGGDGGAGGGSDIRRAGPAPVFVPTEIVVYK